MSSSSTVNGVNDGTPPHLLEESRVCFFCYKFVISSDHCWEDNVQKFFRILGRFLGEEGTALEGVCGGDGRLGREMKWIGCCGDCGLIVSSFCDAYHQLKCLELRLEWKLGSLVNIMRFANRVPSRMEGLRRVILEETRNAGVDVELKDRKMKSFKALRTKLTRKCTRKLSRSLPRVRLKRIVEDNGDNACSTSGLVPPRTPTEASTSNEMTAPVPVPLSARSFLGWSMSFAAVTLLASMTTQPEVATNSSGPSDNLWTSPSPPQIKTPPSVDELDEDGCETPAPDFDPEHGTNSDSNQEKTQDPVPVSRSNVEDHGVIFMATPLPTEVHSLSQNNLEFVNREQSIEAANDVPDSFENSENGGDAEHDVCGQLKSETEEPPISTPGADVLTPNDSSTTGGINRITLLVEKPTQPLNLNVNDGDPLSPQSSAFLEEALTISDRILKAPGSHADPKPKANEPPENRGYNLRERRKRSFAEMEEDSDSQYDNDGDDYHASPNSDLSSSSSFSSDAEDIPGTENEEEQKVDTAELQMEKDRPASVTGPSSSTPVAGTSTLSCPLVDCCNMNKRTVAYTIYHTPGHYKCHFCDVVMEHVFQLYTHEIQFHSKPDAKNAALRKLVNYFHCPRCDFQNRNLSACKIHFARAHIPTFNNSKSQKVSFKYCKICRLKILKTDYEEHWKRLHGNLSEKRNRLDSEDGDDEYHASADSDSAGSEPMGGPAGTLKHCDICQLDISEKKYEHHWKQLHDTADVDPDAIVRCLMGGCPAYFVNRGDGDYLYKSVASHNRQVHKQTLKEFTKKKAAEDKREEKKQKIKCKLCKKLFTTKDDFENHEKLHGSFKCRFCEVVKRFAPDLGFHESEEHAVREEEMTNTNKKGRQLIPCARCPYTCYIRSAFVKHFVSVHLNVDSTGKDFSCSICQAGFASSYNLEDHFQLFHKIEGLSESAIFRCDLCPAYFLQGRQLHDHKRVVHLKNNRCPECGKCFSTFRILISHLGRKHPEFRLFSEESTFTCDIGSCRLQYPSQAALDLHKKSEGQCHDVGQGLKCDICGKEFQTRSSLHMHKKYAHGDNRFVCSECGKVCKSNGSLEIHMKYHQGPEAWKFQCSTCGRKFADKQKVDQHQRTHTKEKPFICQYCGGKFAHRHNWRNHVKTKHPEEFEEGGG